MNRRRFGRNSTVLALLLSITSCGSSDAPVAGSQTNWLKLCDTSSACGDLECICGTCTLACAGAGECADLEGGACVGTDDVGAIAACDGMLPASSLCLLRCEDASCPEGSSCVAGICQSTPAASARVSIDPGVQFQALIGFGASLAHDDDYIVGYPQKERLLDVMFAESGFDVLRLRNRYEPGNEPALRSAQEVVSGASARLGKAPLLFLSSGSPPASLKANGTRSCAAHDTSCTLSRTADGSFDYERFAQHFRSSLEAYAQVGIRPDLVSIQSNVDWLPAEHAAEACFFLPEQGASSVTSEDGLVLEGEFPGYAEAMEAVVAATSSLPAQYSFAGPEVGRLSNLAAYAGSLSNVDSVAYHLYGTDPNVVARGEQPALNISIDVAGKPSIQSAMQADGWATAILAHYALAVENSAGYLQQQFVAPTFDETSTALVGASQDGIETLPAYHALWHFARFTDPGWMRTEAVVDSANLLASAWTSPDGAALTVILINRELGPIDVELVLPEGLRSNASVYRSVFDGVERSAALGRLGRDGVLRLPGEAIVTVAAGSALP